MRWPTNSSSPSGCWASLTFSLRASCSLRRTFGYRAADVAAANAAVEGFRGDIWPVFIPYVLSVAFYMPTIALSNTVAFTTLSRSGRDFVKAFPPIRTCGTVGFNRGDVGRQQLLVRTRFGGAGVRPYGQRPVHFTCSWSYAACWNFCSALTASRCPSVRSTARPTSSRRRWCSAWDWMRSCCSSSAKWRCSSYSRCCWASRCRLPTAMRRHISTASPLRRTAGLPRIRRCWYPFRRYRRRSAFC